MMTENKIVEDIEDLWKNETEDKRTEKNVVKIKRMRMTML